MVFLALFLLTLGFAAVLPTVGPMWSAFSLQWPMFSLVLLGAAFVASALSARHTLKHRVIDTLFSASASRRFVAALCVQPLALVLALLHLTQAQAFAGLATSSPVHLAQIPALLSVLIACFIGGADLVWFNARRRQVKGLLKLMPEPQARKELQVLLDIEWNERIDSCYR